MSYFVSSREETNLQVDPERLAVAIRRSWLGAELRSPNSPASNHSLEWVVWNADRRIDGSLDRAGQVVHLVGDVVDCARFAIWYRGQLAESHRLAFYDEGYSADIDLRAGMNEGQLIEPFLTR
jgi:hypothetical protein